MKSGGVSQNGFQIGVYFLRLQTNIQEPKALVSGGVSLESSSARVACIESGLSSQVLRSKTNSLAQEDNKRVI